jgi:sugar lactone lactonase YvrE
VSPRISFVGEHRNRLGESPLWDERIARLWWVDSVARLICRSDANGGGLESWTAPSEVGSIALAETGLLAALQDGFHAFDPLDGSFEPIAVPEAGNATVRFNDGKADRQGRFLSGTMRTSAEHGAPGKLYRLEPDATTTMLETGTRVSNALCFSPDGGILYFADSLAMAVWAYDYDIDTGAATNRRVLIDTKPLGSAPDGATVDLAGDLWVTLVQGQALAQVSSAGALLRRIDLPIPFPSCPAFGGPGLTTLFLTTVSNSGGALKTDHPDGGRMLALNGLDAVGLPEARCPIPRRHR